MFESLGSLKALLNSRGKEMLKGRTVDFRRDRSWVGGGRLPTEGPFLERCQDDVAPPRCSPVCLAVSFRAESGDATA